MKYLLIIKKIQKWHLAIFLFRFRLMSGTSRLAMNVDKWTNDKRMHWMSEKKSEHEVQRYTQLIIIDILFIAFKRKNPRVWIYKLH